MKRLGDLVFALVVGLLALAATAPALIRLSASLVLPVIVIAAALILGRLVWFHTRRF